MCGNGWNDPLSGPPGRAPWWWVPQTAAHSSAEPSTARALVAHFLLSKIYLFSYFESKKEKNYHRFDLAPQHDLHISNQESGQALIKQQRWWRGESKWRRWFLIFSGRCEMKWNEMKWNEMKWKERSSRKINTSDFVGRFDFTWQKMILMRPLRNVNGVCNWSPKRQPRRKGKITKLLEGPGDLTSVKQVPPSRIILSFFSYFLYFSFLLISSSSSSSFSWPDNGQVHVSQLFSIQPRDTPPWGPPVVMGRPFPINRHASATTLTSTLPKPSLSGSATISHLTFTTKSSKRPATPLPKPWFHK